MFYHIKNLQSTKTPRPRLLLQLSFYHIKNLQSTKTNVVRVPVNVVFYHIKNLQSTKTGLEMGKNPIGFITLRIYKVLKRLGFLIL